MFIVSAQKVFRQQSEDSHSSTLKSGRGHRIPFFGQFFFIHIYLISFFVIYCAIFSKSFVQDQHRSYCAQHVSSSPLNRIYLNKISEQKKSATVQQQRTLFPQPELLFELESLLFASEVVKTFHRRNRAISLWCMKML